VGVNQEMTFCKNEANKFMFIINNKLVKYVTMEYYTKFLNFAKKYMTL